MGALAVNRIQHFRQRSQHRAADLKNIHRAETADAAEARLAQFERRWDERSPSIRQSRRRNGE